MSNHKQFIQQALDLAYMNVVEGKGGPFGAVVVKDEQVIAQGVNLVTSSNDPTAHAEMVAIRNACKVLSDFQLIDCILYSSCEPCPMCLGAIFWARPKEVYFAATAQDAARIGFDDAFIYQQLQKEHKDRMVPFIHIDHHEYLKPFNAWQKAEGKITY